MPHYPGSMSWIRILYKYTGSSGLDYKVDTRTGGGRVRPKFSTPFCGKAKSSVSLIQVDHQEDNDIIISSYYYFLYEADLDILVGLRNVGYNNWDNQ